MHEIKDKNDLYKVSYSPSDEEIDEIENWLLEEMQETKSGFHCNWNSIKSSFDQNEVAIISLNNKAIGFATWQLTTLQTARIVIAEINPNQRNKGVGKKLITELLELLKDKGVL